MRASSPVRSPLLLAFAGGLIVGGGLVALRLAGGVAGGAAGPEDPAAEAAGTPTPRTSADSPIPLVDPEHAQRLALGEPEVESAQAAGPALDGSHMLAREDNRTLLSKVVGDDPVARGTFPSGGLQFEAHRVRTAEGEWILDGAWASFYENGQQEEQGSYQRDREAGQWEWWYDNGQKMAVGTFVNGVREGRWSFWYPDGTKQMDGYYRDGEGSGRWVHWYRSGFKRAEGDTIDDELAGYWKVWHEDGSLDSAGTGIYERGEKASD